MRDNQNNFEQLPTALLRTWSEPLLNSLSGDKSEKEFNIFETTPTGTLGPS